MGDLITWLTEGRNSVVFFATYGYIVDAMAVHLSSDWRKPGRDQVKQNLESRRLVTDLLADT